MVLQRRGTRPCPYCGERIKAIAIRCRYCHADLTAAADPIDAESEPADAAEPEPEPDEDTLPEREEVESDDAALPSEPSWLGRPSATRILVALVALALVAVGFWGLRGLDAGPDTAVGGAGIEENARTEALVTAADLAQRTFTYTYESFDADLESARAKMTASFRSEYDKTMAQIEANTIKNKIASTATVVSAATISATEKKAKVLVFLNQVSTAEDVENAQINKPALLVTVVRRGSDWLLSDVEALR